MHPGAAFADWDDAKQVLVIKARVGGVFVLRDTVAGCLGLEPAQVIALAEDVGGSFGAKNHVYPEYILAAAISRLLKRPVLWVASRSEDGHTTGQAHAADLDFEIASHQDVRLLGLRGKVEWPIGAYFGIGAFQDGSISSHAMSAYRMPALEIEVQPRYSDSPPVVYIRGRGRPVGNFVIARMMGPLAPPPGCQPSQLAPRTPEPRAGQSV